MDIPDLPLIYYPDDRLRLKADPLDATTADAAGLARALFALMYRSKGRGLAATQAGLLHRLFVINPLGDPARPDQERCSSTRRWSSRSLAWRPTRKGA